MATLSYQPCYKNVGMRIVLAFGINTLFNFAIGLLVAKFLGPEEYGRFALALAGAIFVQTALFDWVKLSATRFYSERARSANPALRATLEACFIVAAFVIILLALLILHEDWSFTLASPMIALALIAAIANGLFDFHTAMVRARFLDREYFSLVLTKNVAAFVLTGGGAFYFHSAQMALLGACVSIGGSVIIVRRALHDPMSPPTALTGVAARTALTYALPIVAANALYQMVPLFNRSLIASHYGLAETGQFSLAYDIGVRVVSAIGSTLDVLLFQIAVAADEKHGMAEGKAQIARNMVVVFAIVAPACTGLWLVLPSLEHLMVPEQFRGPFAHYLGIMLPGLFCLAMVNFAINPIFQLAKRTAPLIAAALIAALLDVLVVMVAPPGADGTIIAYAQSGMLAAAFVLLVIFAIFTKPQWPRIASIAAPTFGVAAMVLCVLPMRQWPPTLVTLLLQIATGGAIYGAAVLVFDIAQLRSIMVERLLSARKSAALAR